VLRADAGGWAARASHVGMRGGSCVIYVGYQQASMRPRTAREHRVGEEGEPICDSPYAAAR
jgi:hypothetical protein